MYDFVVVGAGPAGSRFSRSASERGRDVLVLESGEVGRPLACSGHVSLDVWEFVPDDARPELFQNDVYGARFHLEGATGADRREAPDGYTFYKDQPVSNAIDRVGLDETLAECAADAGAEVRDGHTVTRVEEDSGGVRVTARGPDGTETFRGRMVVGADGPRSKVREAVGLPEPDELLHGVLGFDDAPDHRDHVDVHLTVPRFFAWRISGAIPIGPPDRTVGRRSLLVGDAAAQTKPFTGGGILYGMRAADVAAREVDPRQPATLDDYEQAWRAELRRDQRLGHLIRAGYSMPRPVQKAGLRAFSGEIGVHMDRPTSVFSKAQLRALLSWG
ncbi:electron transfer flavoprotein [Halobacteriales archaeon QS_1_69_70]|nr:MAG: electron transfer flavoprotein [Halobacteriales archaeon QS_1_69_70]